MNAGFFPSTVVQKPDSFLFGGVIFVSMFFFVYLGGYFFCVSTFRVLQSHSIEANGDWRRVANMENIELGDGGR